MTDTQSGLNDQNVAVAVVVNGGRVLLVRRARPEADLVWQFPAGKVEAGESPVQAAIRECREETTLFVAAHRVLGERKHPATGRVIHYVACDVIFGVATVGAPDEIADVGWVDLDGLEERIPLGVYGPVQEYLDVEIAAEG